MARWMHKYWNSLLKLMPCKSSYACLTFCVQKDLERERERKREREREREREKEREREREREAERERGRERERQRERGSERERQREGEAERERPSCRNPTSPLGKCCLDLCKTGSSNRKWVPGL